jgi:glutathione S-transferase
VRAATPVLWHIPISHYSEKARWALDLKRVPHRRRALPGGAHMLAALLLTRGKNFTFPVLELDREGIGDSTAIIGALERRWPDPPLYPEDPVERRRGLDLEEHFDEVLGPPIRLLGWHEIGRDPERLATLSARFLPGPLRDNPTAAAVSGRYAALFTNVRYGVNSDEAADEARRTVVAALDRLEAELDGNDYLVGDAFSVADLTAASLFYPLVLPPEAPSLGDVPDGYERFREPLKERSGFKWVAEIFRKHRASSRAVSAAAA